MCFFVCQELKQARDGNEDKMPQGQKVWLLQLTSWILHRIWSLLQGKIPRNHVTTIVADKYYCIIVTYMFASKKSQNFAFEDHLQQPFFQYRYWTITSSLDGMYAASAADLASNCPSDGIGSLKITYTCTIYNFSKIICYMSSISALSGLGVSN